MTLELGTKVRFDARRTLWRESGPGTRKWSSTAWGLPHSPREGIIIGVRTLANGTAEYHYDSGYVFYPTEHFKAYLVAFDMRRKPVYVLPEDLEEIE